MIPNGAFIGTRTCQMIGRAGRVVILLAVFGNDMRASQVRAAQVAERVVGDSVTCSRCTIQQTFVARVGAESGPGHIIALPSAMTEDSRGRFWLSQGSEPLCVFGRDGRFERCVGKRGRGVGEFASPSGIFSASGDSMVVVDAGVPRVSVLSADGAVGRTLDISEQMFGGVVVRWPGSVYLSGANHGVSAVGWPIHQVSFAGDHLETINSFGPDNGKLLPGGEGSSTLRLALSRTGTLWSVDMTQYRLAEFKPDGTKLRILRRNPAWFSGTSTAWIGNPTTPPPPQAIAVREDESGYLWVFVRTASPTWRDGWSKVKPGTTEVGFGDISLDKMFRTTIEIIDPSAGAVVARRALDLWVVGAIRGGRVVTYKVDASGPRLDVIQLKLERR